MSRAEQIRRRLEERFGPARLEVVDESRKHAGHAGAAGGESHFRVRIVADEFRGLAPLARHRLVYAALDDMLKDGIHALALDAAPPADLETGVPKG